MTWTMRTRTRHSATRTNWRMKCEHSVRRRSWVARARAQGQCLAPTKTDATTCLPCAATNTWSVATLSVKRVWPAVEYGKTLLRVRAVCPSCASAGPVCSTAALTRSLSTQEEGISQMMERYSRVSRATTSGGMGQGLFNPRNRSTRHIIGDFSDLEASGEIARPETVLSQAPPIGSAKRAAFLRRNLTPLHSG